MPELTREEFLRTLAQQQGLPPERFGLSAVGATQGNLVPVQTNALVIPPGIVPLVPEEMHLKGLPLPQGVMPRGLPRYFAVMGNRSPLGPATDGLQFDEPPGERPGKDPCSEIYSQLDELYAELNLSGPAAGIDPATRKPVRKQADVLKAIGELIAQHPECAFVGADTRLGKLTAGARGLATVVLKEKFGSFLSWILNTKRSADSGGASWDKNEPIKKRLDPNCDLLKKWLKLGIQGWGFVNDNDASSANCLNWLKKTLAALEKYCANMKGSVTDSVEGLKEVDDCLWEQSHGKWK